MTRNDLARGFPEKSGSQWEKAKETQRAVQGRVSPESHTDEQGAGWQT